MGVQTRAMKMLNDGDGTIAQEYDEPIGSQSVPQTTFRTCVEIQKMSVTTKFTVPLGEALPKRGDIIRHWMDESIEEGMRTAPLDILPPQTIGIRVEKVLSIQQVDTGYTVEGVHVTVEGELVLMN